MPGEKKLWKPFGRLASKQEPLKAKAGRSRSRVSSVYLSDDSSTSGFIVVPEFDHPALAERTQEEYAHTSPIPHISAVTSSGPFSPDGVNGCPYGLPVPNGGSYLCGCSLDTSVVQDHDLVQRLGSAYDRIHSMPSAASPKVTLSSDPQVLRKQLGVPQHSVFNYPIHSTLDLPNPHSSPRQSPRPPPATSQDASHTRTSKGLGLRAITDVYPHSPRHRPDPCHPPQRKSTITAPTLPENSPLEHGTPGGPARIACTSKPQAFISKSSKALSKRSTDIIIVSPSSTSSSRRQALRGVLRKTAVDTSPSNIALRRQISLPLMRPSSPFRVDIPLYHTWHDRRTNFNSPHECHSKFHEKRPRRTTGSTNVLASLAWIGIPPVTPSPHIAIRGGHEPASSALLPGRLSMAIAVEDDSISDDVLVDQLEEVRKIDGPERGRDISPLHTSRPSFLPSTAEQLAKSRDAPSPLILKDKTLDLDDAVVWQTARKALLCIREIIRTEKKYQEAMKMLLSAQTTTPPPPSMAPFISALVHASEMLLRCFLEDPSAWGVSTAFVTSEDELEAAMVSWSAVAGGFFTDGNDPQSSGLTGKWRLRKSAATSSSARPITKQSSISFTPQLPPMFSTVNKIKEQMDEEHHAECSHTEQERKTACVLPRHPESTDNQTISGQPPSRKLSVRDLAIQPIQRVMRYVLLYRDLLDCTPPPSPSRILVERALETATRIANHCDRAQRNPAFCHDS